MDATIQVNSGAAAQTAPRGENEETSSTPPRSKRPYARRLNTLRAISRALRAYLAMFDRGEIGREDMYCYATSLRELHKMLEVQEFGANLAAVEEKLAALRLNAGRPGSATVDAE